MIYQIGSARINADDPALQQYLARAYGAPDRPLCLCRPSGVPMYVAKLGETFLIKRMPNSGEQHAPSCDSYEPPPELSGRGEVIRSAIQENPEEGTTALKLGFSLSKGAGRAPPSASGKESDSVKTDGQRLSLRGTLHYLWDEAGFNHWSPAMAHKRNWHVIRKYLMQAAHGKMTKGISLADVLYVPEFFTVERKGEIAQRRMAKMQGIAAPEKNKRPLMLVIGEVKELTAARYGHKIVLKHSPDFHFMLNDDIHRRLLKRFEAELSLSDVMQDLHLMMIGTFSMGSTGVASLEEVALMCVTENWIPFENVSEKAMLEALTTQRRHFVKGMRYNLPSTQPLASVVVSDTEPPTAMYVVQPGVTEEFMGAMDALVAGSSLPSWVWLAGEEDMPALPALRAIANGEPK